MAPVFNVATALVALLGVASAVSAQEFPTKPIRLVVGFHPAGVSTSLRDSQANT